MSEVTPEVGVPAAIKSPIKPELFSGKSESQLAKLVGVTQFGVNQVTLQSGAMSSLRHWHEGEDEFVYVLRGELTLVDDNGEHRLREGTLVGFPAGVPNAHHILNRSDQPASFLAVGTRKVGREVIHYPDDAIGAVIVHRNGRGERV